MIIVYYRRPDGSIRNCHQYPAGKTLAEIQALADTYNEELIGVDMACIAEVENNSIEAYLFQKAFQKKTYDKQLLANLVNTLEEALDTARGLGD